MVSKAAMPWLQAGLIILNPNSYECNINPPKHRVYYVALWCILEL